MKFRLARVCCLLFGSGACALVYQTAWFRELRLIFGASTAASAAVLAVFMAGLGAGGLIFGKRADRSPNPLAMYANLELGVSIAAGVTPLLVWLADAAYIATGGVAVLGNVGALLFRLVLSIMVLGPATLLMGGTLPAAARAVERSSDGARKDIAALYGVNTLGAVLGAVAANFLLVEVFGARMTLWLACLVNLLVGITARALSRVPDAAPAGAPSTPAQPELVAETVATVETVATIVPLRFLRLFPPAAAAMTGATFMLMELVWYRMLSPLLGGSSYTFGLILAVALAGIGIGSALYARLRVVPTLATFAATCALEALVIAIPLALGDRVAILAWLLRPLASTGFGASVLAWSVIASIVVLPGAIVSGAQFPMVIGLYGRGDNRVGRDVGAAYLANTIGAIVGSIAGGFGLLPALSAPTCWRMVVVLLLVTAGVALALSFGTSGRRALRENASRGAVACAIVAVLLLGAEGPSALWRHSGIGAGRADRRLETVTATSVIAFERAKKAGMRWEADGLESSVAIDPGDGFAFIVNGKADGHSIIDAPTQVMGGVLGALLHPDPRRALVIGLGTGSTAGWLGAIASIDRVDVIELEPAIMRVASDCAAVNHDVLANPKVKVRLGDAREVLRTSRERYDVIFSEPSNPFRAGISSLYTEEFYRAASGRLLPNGIFMQWVQAYEVDAGAIATTIVTLKQVYEFVSLWRTMDGDLLLIAQHNRPAVDLDEIGRRLEQPGYAQAVRSGWKTATTEGVLTHFIANPELADLIVKNDLGAVNHDDQNILEFAFARGVGRHRSVDEDFKDLARRLRLDTPAHAGAVDPELLLEERWVAQANAGRPLDPRPDAVPAGSRGFAEFLDLAVAGRYKNALAHWRKLDRKPRAWLEAGFVADAAANSGDPEGDALVDGVPNETERELYRAVLWARLPGRRPADPLLRGLSLLRNDPWVRANLGVASLELAVHLSNVDRAVAPRMFAALAEPFAAEAFRGRRLWARVRIGRSIDARHCAEALHAMEPAEWEASVLELRVACYREANDPLLAAAEEDVAKLRAVEGKFGNSLPTPPRPAAPPPSAAADAGSP